MSENVKLTMNLVEFNRVLRLTWEKSSRTFPEFINGQSYRLALDAYLHTPYVGQERIQLMLGRTSTQVFHKKTGARLKKAKAIYSSKASLDLYRIVNWRRVRAGQRPLGGKEMSRVARAARAAMMRAGGYVGGGWLYAVNKLKRLTRQAGLQAVNHKIKMSGAQKGYVKPATFTLSGVVSCELGMSTLLARSAARTGSRPGKPMLIAQRGLETARYYTAQNMLNHLAEKVKPVLDQHSAK